MIYAKIKDQEEQKQLDDALDSSKSKKWYRRLPSCCEFCQKVYCKATEYNVRHL